METLYEWTLVPETSLDYARQNEVKCKLIRKIQKSHEIIYDIFAIY